MTEQLYEWTKCVHSIRLATVGRIYVIEQLLELLLSAPIKLIQIISEA